jgi:tetratricopeptide (TPR) repeat protein
MDYRGQEGTYTHFVFKPNEELEKLIKKYPEDWQLYKLLGRYYLEVMFKYSNQWLISNEELLKKARENYLVAYEHNIYDYRSLFDLGYIELVRQEPNEAIKYFKKSIELNDGYSASQYNLGYAYFSTGKENDALPYLKKSYTLYLQEKNNEYAADTARLLTMIYAKKGDHTQAKNYYEEARQLNIDYLGQKYLLNNILQNKNDPSLSEYIATDLWQLDPDNPTIYDDLLSAYFNADSSNDLIKILDKLAEKNQNEPKYLASIYFYRGKLELNLAHQEPAKEYFTKAKEKFISFDANHPALKAIDEALNELQ